MAMFALIHGGGDVGWYWHLLERELRERGHETVAPDLPCDDGAAGLDDYAETVVRAVVEAAGDRDDHGDLVVVGTSYGGFTAPVVADRLAADVLVLVTALVPAPGERPADWWTNVGHGPAVAEQGRRDGGKTGSDDPFVGYYHDVPRALAEEAQRRERDESTTAYHDTWPLDAWPAVPTRYVLCTEDRFLPPALMRRVVTERLGIVVDEIAAGHSVALARPAELADLLAGYAAATAAERAQWVVSPSRSR